MEQENIKLTFDSNAKSVAGDVNKLGASIESTTTSTNENNQAVNQGNESYKTFKTQLREANAELQKSIQLTGESSQETIKAAKSVADLKDQMQYAKDLADQFNPDQKMKALGAATQVAGTGLQGVTAGMALFGDQSKDTQAQLLKVQAAMAFSDAISNLSNLGDQWSLLKSSISSSTLFTKANTAATGTAAMVQKLFTGSVETSSTGFKGLKLAIAGTGIGLLVVGLAMVVTNFDKIKSIMSNIGWLKKVGETIGNIVNAITDFIGVTSEADRVIDRQKKHYEKSIAQNEKYLERNANTISDARKREIELSNEHFKRVAEGRFSELESHKIFEEAKTKDAKEAQEKRQKDIDDANKKAKEKREQEAKESLEEHNKHQDDLLKTLEGWDEKDAELKKLQDERDSKNQDKLLENLEFLNQKEKDNQDDMLTFLENDSDKQENIRKNELESKTKLHNSLNDLGNQGVAAAKDLFAKNKNVQKGIIVAEGGVALGKLAVNTVEAVSKDNKNSPATLGMPWSGIHIGQGILGAATIISSTNKQLQALGGGGSISGGSSTPQMSQAIPSVAFNNTAENQIGQSIAKTQAEQPPLKVYVAESDISKAQNNVKVLVNNNTF